MNFKELLNRIYANRDNHLKGDFNCIPFLNFKRLEAIIPGIEKECYTLIGASSSIGKSSFLRDLYINNPIRYIEGLPSEQKDSVKLDVLYFSLEESEMKITNSELSKYIFSKYRKIVTPTELMSVGRKNKIPDDVLDILPECEFHMNRFSQYVKIYDNITDPYWIFKTVRDFALDNGMYYKKDGNFYSDDVKKRLLEGHTFTEDEMKQYSGYRTYHPNHYVLVLVDHVSLLTLGDKETLRDTMYRFSTKYCIRMRDTFGFSPVIVQQFSSDSEQVQFNYQGRSIEEKLEPATTSFGDCKTNHRDANVVLGLFNPNKYNIQKYNGYDITRLQNNFRTLHVLKNRSGVAGIKVPMFFNGQTGMFNELPRPMDDKMERIYEYSERLIEEFKQRAIDEDEY